MPTASTPNVPQTPWTAIAPTGSSTPLRSMNVKAKITRIPAMMPITMAAHGCTNAHGAVMATRPASMPFTIIPGSGFLAPVYMSQNIAATAPNAAAIAVFVATTAKRTSVTAKVDAALKPNQPNSRMKHPSIAIGMWCPASVRGLAVLAELADAGTEHEGTGQPGDTADRVHDAGAGEVDVPERRGRRCSPSLASQPPPQVQAPNIG